MKARALAVNEAVSAGLPTARDVLGNVNEYCLYGVGGEVVIEYWRDKELSVKLIRADDPANALMNCYNAEKAGLVSVPRLLVMVAREVKDVARQVTYRYFMYSSFTL
ncbi:MAG: hypothetical protein RXO24_01795 [Acidilobus sp.]